MLVSQLGKLVHAPITYAAGAKSVLSTPIVTWRLPAIVTSRLMVF